MTQTRQPAGVPIGGQFATDTRSRSGVSLDGGEPASAFPVSVRELQFVDPRANSDKFYRVFVNGSEVSTQYGRNGTAGTFTAPKDYGSPEAAAKAADKAVAGKTAKGYDLIKEGVLDFDTVPSESDLDSASGMLEAGGTASAPQLREQHVSVAAVNAAEVDESVLPRVAAALEALGFSYDRSLANGEYQQALPARPMLAQVVDPAELNARLDDDNWVTQPKLDGDRVMIQVIDGEVSVLNRQGQAKVRNVSEAMTAPFRSLNQGRWVIDGEVVGRTFHAFDMPAAGGFHDESADYATRAATLDTVLAEMNLDHEVVRPVRTASGSVAKRAMLADAKANRREGIILRDARAGYSSGRRSPDLLKHKLHKEVDAFIVEVGKGGKDNAVLGVRRPDGTTQIIGQVSTLGKGEFRPGDVVEARFLYTASADNPTLFQPRIMRKRTDKSAAECSIDQLANAHTDKNVDEPADSPTEG